MDAKELSESINQLWNVNSGLLFPYNRLGMHINQAVGANTWNEKGGEESYKAALKDLAEIEDTIKRYRQNLPQSFQEK